MLNTKPPLAYTSAGKVYRKDDDATFAMFHQVEGIYVDKEELCPFKDLIHKIIYGIFMEVEVRFRPSIFLSLNLQQVDILSENGKWLEILGGNRSSSSS